MPPKATKQAAAGAAEQKRRERFLGKVELIRKLHAAGEEHRAHLMHRNLSADADRLEGEVYRSTLPGYNGGITAWQRMAHRRRIDALRRQAAALLVGPRPRN